MNTTEPASSTSTPPKSTQAARRDRIVAGLRRLEAERKPGECFTETEIAEACGVTHRAIVFILRKATYNFAKALHAQAPDLFVSHLGSEQAVKTFFTTLNRNPCRTGEPTGRTPKQRAETVLRRRRRQLEKRPYKVGGVTDEQFAVMLAASNS